jgi:hypothetical protein
MGEGQRQIRRVIRGNQARLKRSQIKALSKILSVMFFDDAVWLETKMGGTR